MALAIPHAHAQSDPADDSDGGRVIGGEAAAKGKWPWQVKILAPDPGQRGRFGGHCGGSLISPQWILTAAHCVSSSRTGKQELFARDLLIIEGKSKIDKVISVDGPDKPGLAVAEVIVHKDYDRKVFANDIALIKLAEPAISKPVALASPADEDIETPGRLATVTGWGYTKADHGWDEKYLPTVLQEVQLPIVSREECLAGYRDSTMRMNPIDQRNVCAGYADGGKDACQGDSGGPLVAQRADQSWAQIGVVSWGAGCAEARHYGVYTRVAAFRDWITEATKGEVPAPPSVSPVAAATGQASEPDSAPAGQQSDQTGPIMANLAIKPPVTNEENDQAEPTQTLSDENSAPAANEEDGQATPTQTLGDENSAPAPNEEGGQAEPTQTLSDENSAPAANDEDGQAEPTQTLSDQNSAPAATVEFTGSPGDKALLIGIDEYAMSEMRLVGSTNDVEAVHTLLTTRLGFEEDQIRILTNGQATREGILAAIDDWLVRGSTPDSRVLFYFSGQGSEETGADIIASPTIVAADAGVEQADGKLTVTEQIRETEIAARLNSLKDRRTTLLIDACHVGPGSRSVAAAPKGMVRCLGPALASLGASSLDIQEAKFSFGGERAMVWSAVNAGQWALVDREANPPLGVFTRNFIEGVKNGAGRAASAPSVSNAELLDYVRRKSQEYCRSYPDDCRFSPVPQFYGEPDALGRDVITGEQAKTLAAAAESTLKTENEAGVSIEVLPGTAVKIGEKVAMRVSTRKPGYLILVDIDSSGKLTQLYPNKRSMGLKSTAISGDNRLDPSRPITIPDERNPYIGFEYEIEGPAGVGMVVAVLSEKPIQILDLPDVPTPLAGQRAGFNYVYELARSLRIVGDDEDGAAQGKWSFDSKFYRVQ